MPPPIVRQARDGYDVYMKNDGRDYWPIVKVCIEENIDQDALIRNFPAKPPIPVRRDGLELELKPLVYSNPKRMVFRLDLDGRSYVLKRARMGTAGFKRLLPGVMGVTYFTRIMRMVNRAVRAGCDVTQDYYLVAEKPVSAFRQEVWVLLGYLDGDSLGAEADFPVWRDGLTETVKTLIRHGLTMDDLTLHNFLVEAGKVRAIDISCRPFTRLQAVKMAIKMNARYGLNLPVTGFFDTLLHLLLTVRYRLRRAFGKADY